MLINYYAKILGIKNENLYQITVFLEGITWYLKWAILSLPAVFLQRLTLYVRFKLPLWQFFQCSRLALHIDTLLCTQRMEKLC